MSKQYNPSDVLEILHNLGVGIKDRTLTIKTGTLGLKKIGMVDFLVNYHHYSVVWMGW